MQNVSKIELKQVKLGYRKGSSEHPILKSLNLEFFGGSFIGIVGLNGSGKSTLLKSLCGLLPVLEGEIRINEHSISNISVEALARQISIVLTERIGGFNLTAFDVVASGQIPYTNAFHQLKAENIAPIQHAIKACGISEHRHKPVTELSDGLFQKTMIAKALAQQTPVILLDEPSAFLDYASKHELFRLLQQLAKQEQKCVLLSSHDLDLILTYCSQVLVISEETAELIQPESAKENSAFLKITGGYL